MINIDKTMAETAWDFIEEEKALLQKLYDRYGMYDADIGRQLEKAKQILLRLNGCCTYIELYYLEDKETNRIYFDESEDESSVINNLLHKAAKYYCFNDLDASYEIKKVMLYGHEIKYVGWQPGMQFEFKNKAGETIWNYSFPEWEH